MLPADEIARLAAAWPFAAALPRQQLPDCPYRSRLLSLTEPALEAKAKLARGLFGLLLARTSPPIKMLFWVWTVTPSPAIEYVE